MSGQIESLITELSVADARKLIAYGTISADDPQGRDLHLRADQGVEGVVIMDNGKVPDAVLLELLTDHGVGTLMHLVKITQVPVYLPPGSGNPWNERFELRNCALGSPLSRGRAGRNIGNSPPCGCRLAWPHDLCLIAPRLPRQSSCRLRRRHAPTSALQPDQLPYSIAQSGSKRGPSRDARLVSRRSRPMPPRPSTGRSTFETVYGHHAHRFDLWYLATAAGRTRGFLHPDGDFAIASRHVAARPAAGTFQPDQTVGFSERAPPLIWREADYDDAQARRAGIQRLLVIAGYAPIQSTGSGRSQAAIATIPNGPQACRRHRIGADVFRQVDRGRAKPGRRRLLLVHQDEIRVMASIGVVEMGAVVTRGWYRIEAGQCVRPDLRGDPRRLYSYAEAVDSNGRTVKRGDAPLAWGGTVALCTRDGRFEVSDHKDCATRGLNSAGFAVIDLGAQPSMTVRFKEQ